LIGPGSIELATVGIGSEASWIFTGSCKSDQAKATNMAPTAIENAGTSLIVLSSYAYVSSSG
jgi:hypothetical protein